MARTRPGRSCPRHYRYSPAVFARAAELRAQSLFIVGGLYGNPFALEAVLAMARREGATLAFNGDFNWFNVDDAGFRAINERVLAHDAILVTRPLIRDGIKAKNKFLVNDLPF